MFGFIFSHIFLKFTIKFVKSTRKSHMFNNEFTHLLYGNKRNLCKKMKSNISLLKTINKKNAII
jgi:hypothetical protein